MNRMTKKIAVVAGNERKIVATITGTLLTEGATVICPLKSAEDISHLKKSLCHLDTMKLVTFLTDYSDYNKIKENAENMLERFGHLDLAIICFASPEEGATLAETNINDWDKMVDANLTSYFVGSRVLLPVMKGKNAVYITISHAGDNVKKPGSALANLASEMQKEMAEIIHKEATATGLRYHHLFVYDNANNSSTTSGDTTGDFILRLYKDTSSDASSLFRHVGSNQLATDFII